jgi:hypothetical protein
VTRGWRKLHSEELHNLYSSPNIVKVIKSMRMRWLGNVACIGEMRNVRKILVEKPEGKRSLMRPRCRWEDIKMDLREKGFWGVDWIHLAQNRDWWQALVNMVMNL